MAIQGQPVFLSEEDLVYLTGYRLPSAQAQHLLSQGIPFYLDRLGHPRVARSFFDSGAPLPAKTVGPNLEWLRT